MSVIPSIIEERQNGPIGQDLFSRMYQDRIVFVFGEITRELALGVIAQLVYLDSISHDDITIYINSPGGSVTDGFAIYDTIKYIKSDVRTICVGMAASMGAFLLAGGTKGKRFALPNSEVMIHQPLGGVSGQASDIKIVADHILDIRLRINKILASATGKSIDEISKDTERDNYLTSKQALEYGLIDEVILRQE